MSRFFEPFENINESDGIINFSRDNANHLTVLRHSKGDIITVCDGAGIDYECEIQLISKNDAVVSILRRKKCESEPDFKITLFQALPKSDKMELIIQKSIELGVHKIIPVVTHNTVVRIKNNVNTKIQRYMKISETAAKQCNRGIIPNISSPVEFDTAIHMLAKKEASFVAYENAKLDSGINLMNIEADEIGIFIGPEGGFTAEEVEKCVLSKIKPVSLGKRILRTETAGIAALSTIVYSKEYRYALKKGDM
ncbi:MAG: 16S rRNA (uracil(1498)-N(3))-methyltransferase [Defluviitaleaceae bacterium]|nr:16S rRNA (uracil(1498)-N(3))-methyltransferase [Defluviitaleaceae bacterium]